MVFIILCHLEGNLIMRFSKKPMALWVRSRFETILLTFLINPAANKCIRMIDFGMHNSFFYWAFHFGIYVRCIRQQLFINIIQRSVLSTHECIYKQTLACSVEMHHCIILHIQFIRPCFPYSIPRLEHQVENKNKIIHPHVSRSGVSCYIHVMLSLTMCWLYVMWCAWVSVCVICYCLRCSNSRLSEPTFETIQQIQSSWNQIPPNRLTVRIGFCSPRNASDLIDV